MKLIQKFFYSTFFVLLFTCSLQAQTATPAYISHTIAPGETLSGLAKQYHTTVGNIMRLNHMNTKSVLTLGEVVKIPTVKTPSAPVVHPTAAVARDTTMITRPAPPGHLIPIMHTVAKGESLYTLSKKYKTTVAEIKAWNKLNSNIIVDGHSLIVGYAGTTNAFLPPPAPPAQSQPEANTLQDTIIQQQTIQQPSQDTTTAQPTAGSTPLPIASPPSATVEQIQKPQAAAPVVDMANIPAEGYFTSSFGIGMAGHKLQTVSGTSMTFKTTSGWDDKKYYILINNVPPGSIVRVLSADNKVIYAKVLWGITGMKENEGLDFRISAAAAAALGESNAKFPLSVTLYE